MKSERSDDRPGYDKASLLKTAGLAAALGVATWLLAPILLPAKLPDDFPKTPDLQKVNPSLRKLLQSVDRDARRKPGSAEAMGKLAMAYHANLFLEQGARGLSDCRTAGSERLPVGLRRSIPPGGKRRREG
ncbi:MAG: hypothetical protein WDO73_28315 [Ignavibacteriota bacterium]